MAHMEGIEKHLTQKRGFSLIKPKNCPTTELLKKSSIKNDKIDKSNFVSKLLPNQEQQLSSSYNKMINVRNNNADIQYSVFTTLMADIGKLIMKYE